MAASLGRMSVMTRAGKPVYGIEAHAVKGVSALSHGVARGVNVSAATAGMPLSPEEFKQEIRGMLR